MADFNLVPRGTVYVNISSNSHFDILFNLHKLMVGKFIPCGHPYNLSFVFLYMDQWACLKQLYG